MAIPTRDGARYGRPQMVAQEAPPVLATPPRARLVLVSDDPLRLLELRSVLEPGLFVVIAAVHAWRDAHELALHYEPDVVLVDGQVLKGGAADVRELCRRRPGVRIVVFAPEDQAMLPLELLRAGAGVVERSAALSGLPRVLTAVLAGEVLVPRALVGSLVAQLRTTPVEGEGWRPVRSALTPREWEVLDALCAGHGTLGVAEELDISVETVRSHVKCILRKLEVPSRAAAVARARSLRLPRPDALVVA